MTNNKNGFVYLVGAGPGNPDYLTIKGLRVIESADVILYDALLDNAFLDLFPAKAKSIYVGKRCGQHSFTQNQINSIIIENALENKTVVRLKGGDPYLFGRGGEEVESLLQENIPFEIVPGVSALQAAGAFANIPVTHRGISDQVLLLNGHSLQEKFFDWNYFAKFPGTIVVFMGTGNIQEICKNLYVAGMPAETPIALMESVSFQNQSVKYSNVSQIAINGISKTTEGPGIIYIGNVVNLFRKNQSLVKALPLEIGPNTFTEGWMDIFAIDDIPEEEMEALMKEAFASE